MIKKISIVADSDIGNLIEALAATGLPVISEYELGRVIFLKLSASTEERNELFRPVIEHLQTLKIFVPLSLGGATHAYQLFGHSTASAQQIACALDPFAYVSHLSAMEYHGLTDRFPKILYLTRPTAGEWKQQAEEKMRRDLGERYEEYLASRLPRLVRPKLSKIAQVNLHFQERSQLGAFKHVSGSNLRVATIGRVFLEMTREPQLCGGIQHVVDIFSSNAKQYLRLIVDEYERHGKAIDKVRAGYLLTEVCGLTDSVVESWLQFAQRGAQGSWIRKRNMLLISRSAGSFRSTCLRWLAMTNELIQELSLVQWVATAPDEQRGFREAVHIILAAIGKSADLSSRMVMKGGLLMAIRYDSTRFTRDIDFSTLEKHRQADELALLSELDEQLVWANDHLSYDTMCLRQNAKLNPKSPEASFPTLQISIGYAPRSNPSHLRRLQAKQSSTKVQIDYSFDEAVFDVEILALEDGEQLKAYSLTNLLAEKYRSLLQQPIRRRTRRQDVFDIHMLLTRCAALSGIEQSRLLRQVIDSCKARGIAATQVAMTDALVREMARADYHGLADEIDEELPDFDSAYAMIQAFYEGLPWGN